MLFRHTHQLYRRLPIRAASFFQHSSSATIPSISNISRHQSHYYFAASTTTSIASIIITSSSLFSTASINTTKLEFHQIQPTPYSAAAAATPLPRSSHGLSIIQNGTLLVLYGGEHVARTPIDDPNQSLWVAMKQNSNSNNNDNNNNDSSWQWIVPKNNSSVEKEEVPMPRVAHAQSSVGNDIYMFGGRVGIDMDENALNDLWMLQLHHDDENDTTTTNMTAKWTQIKPTTPKIPEARSFHKMITVGTNLYMFGGCGASGGRLNDLWKFDTLTHTWSDLGSSHLLRGRGGPNILSFNDDENNNNKIAIVAGFAGEEMNDGHVYNCNTNKWEKEGMKGLQGMRPRSVCCFGSFPQPLNKWVIFGGEVDPSQKGHEGAGGFERDVVILDAVSGNVLETITSPSSSDDDDVEWPGSRGWSDAAVYEDTMYIFGGLAGDDVSPIRLDDLWQCKVSSSSS